MLSAIDHFIYSEVGGTGQTTMECFADFLQDLPPQPVQISFDKLSSLMLESYQHRTVSSDAFKMCSGRSALAVIEQFLWSRECFYFRTGCEPIVEATFHDIKFSSRGDLDVNIYFSWNPPKLSFTGLRSVVNEGETYVLSPELPGRRPFCALENIVLQHTVGPAQGFLRWDEKGQHFVGHVTPELAARFGAQRMDVFTIQLDLVTTITHSISSDATLEKVIRCWLPLTIKRHPDRCLDIAQATAIPRMARPNASLILPEHTSQRRPSVPLREHTTPQSTLGKKNPLRRPKVPTPVHYASPSLPRLRPTQHVLNSVDAIEETKENRPTSTFAEITLKDLDALLQKKASQGRPQSPLRLNSLSVAVLHDSTSKPPRRWPRSERVEASIPTQVEFECGSSTAIDRTDRHDSFTSLESDGNFGRNLANHHFTASHMSEQTQLSGPYRRLSQTSLAKFGLGESSPDREGRVRDSEDKAKNTPDSTAAWQRKICENFDEFVSARELRDMMAKREVEDASFDVLGGSDDRSSCGWISGEELEDEIS